MGSKKLWNVFREGNKLLIFLQKHGL